MSLAHLFEVSNVANNVVSNLWIPEGYALVKAIEFSKTMKCIIFRKSNEMKISFSSFTFQNVFNFLNIGYQLLAGQELQMLDESIGMNSFFHYWSYEFFKEAEKVITDFSNEDGTENLVLTGMSMGGAMSQCFYYHVKNSALMSKLNVSVLAFGSPRVGNAGLQKWFDEQGDSVTNYTICSEVDGKIMVDPVCLFPPKKYGYVNNKSLTVYHSRKVYEGKPFNMYTDTDVSFANFWEEWTFIKNADQMVWDVVHQFNEYMKHLANL